MTGSAKQSMAETSMDCFVAFAPCNDVNKKACRHLRRQARFQRAGRFYPDTDATLVGLSSPNSPERLNDLSDDAADAGAGQTDRAGSAGGQVQHPPTDEGAAVVNGDDYAAAAMGDPELGAER